MYSSIKSEFSRPFFGQLPPKCVPSPMLYYIWKIAYTQVESLLNFKAICMPFELKCIFTFHILLALPLMPVIFLSFAFLWLDHSLKKFLWDLYSSLVFGFSCQIWHLMESFCCVGSPGVFITPGTYHVFYLRWNKVPTSTRESVQFFEFDHFLIVRYV